MIFIREGTRAHRLLMLLACVGEYPMQAVCLLGNDRVWKRRIRQLQKVEDFCLPDGAERVRLQMLTVSGKGKSKTIRLHKSALPMLRKTAPEAFHYYTEHFPDHHFSGAATHVSRNHRIAEVVAMCMAAKIGVLPWSVRDLHDPQVRYQNVDRACCYLSGALKEFYADEMEKTGFTRIAGAIVYPQGVYAVYNTRDQPMLWRGRGEEKAQILLSSIFRAGGFRTEVDSAILVGRDFRTAAATLEDAFARRHLKERLDQVYRHLHFIPQNEFGVKLLQLITMEDWDAKLREAVFGNERANQLPRGLEHDAYIDGAYHFSHLDGDLCRLIRFRRSMRNWPEEQYVLVCYSEQVPYLKEYLGDLWDGANLRVQRIDLDALHTHLQKA